MEDKNEKRKRAIESYMENENVIEFLRDQEIASVTLCQGRFKSKIKKLVEKYPESCSIIAENEDGSLYAHIPVSWIKFNAPLQLSEEQREKKREVMRSNRK